MEKRDARLQGTLPTQGKLQSRPKLQWEVGPSGVHWSLGREPQQTKVHIDERLSYPPLSAWIEIQSQGPATAVVIRPFVGGRERRHAQGMDFEVPAHDGVLKVEHVTAQANTRREHLLSRIRTDDIDGADGLGSPNRHVAEKRWWFRLGTIPRLISLVLAAGNPGKEKKEEQHQDEESWLYYPM
jgi:hypothetical protein